MKLAPKVGGSKKFVYTRYILTDLSGDSWGIPLSHTKFKAYLVLCLKGLNNLDLGLLAFLTSKGTHLAQNLIYGAACCHGVAKPLIMINTFNLPIKDFFFGDFLGCCWDETFAAQRVIRSGSFTILVTNLCIKVIIETFSQSKALGATDNWFFQFEVTLPEWLALFMALVKGHLASVNSAVTSSNKGETGVCVCLLISSDVYRSPLFRSQCFVDEENSSSLNFRQWGHRHQFQHVTYIH